jgi:hypothetical protein
MANIQRNFIAGRMNKGVDERLVPNGEYIDALNVRLGSTEETEIGSVENSKGNEQLTQLQFNGTALSNNAKCIGAFEDGANETIYWFIHDSSFSVGATGKLDLIVSFKTDTKVLTYHVISINDGAGVNTTLNFNPLYLVNGINLVDNLLLFTDNFNAPRFINITRNYDNPASNIDQFSAESLLVVKKPPTNSPVVQTLTTNSQENLLEDKFLSFAYRYKYEDNEYSATSQFSAPAFIPKAFNFTTESYTNEGFENLVNQANITFNTGGPLVKEIELLYKDMNSNIIKSIEKLNKLDLGYADNTDYVYNFASNKIFTLLPESEILRLYDNVPLKAKAQTLMGNRLIYGNYFEGYDLLDANSQPVKFEYETSLVTNEISEQSITDTNSNGNYTIDGSVTVNDSIVSFDLSGLDLVQGASLNFTIRFQHSQFTGGASPTETTGSTSIELNYVLPQNFSSVFELASSTDFQEKIGTAANIKPVYHATNPTSCSGETLTDEFNCAIPATLDTFNKFDSGISGGGQPLSVITTPSSSSIGIQLLAVRFVNNLSTPTVNVYEYYQITFAEGGYVKIANSTSLHSDRDYEIGIVYMDEFNRATTALVSENNSIHVPCSNSITQNIARVTIPPQQVAPHWASRYKLVCKPNKEDYETIYSNVFFYSTQENATYFLLEGENQRKVEVGDRYKVKADTQGPLLRCEYATVLDKRALDSTSKEFDPPPQDSAGNNITVPPGTYMKIRANNFTAERSDNQSLTLKDTATQRKGDNFVILQNLLTRVFNNDTSQYDEVSIPAGSIIVINLDFDRPGRNGPFACPEVKYEVDDLSLVASQDYDSFKEWFEGDNVIASINNAGVETLETTCTPDGLESEYEPANATSKTDISTALCEMYYKFFTASPTGEQVLLISGTRSCEGSRTFKKNRASITARFDITRATQLCVFETDPSSESLDIWYESSTSYSIDANGNHSGNVQNQDISTSQSAIIDSAFFNCFTYGNGVESFKIRDSLIGQPLKLGNRVTAVSNVDYKEAHRFADLTYSGVFNDETNINKLNEFNLGLSNFKPLEDTFGEIQLIDGRETDILTLQEDKISYVLAGKNLLSDAAAGGAITSIPEVLGTQIARIEKYGISFNPESYVKWGYDKYFTDSKRGAVIQLKGGSFRNEQLTVISERGMRSWFRDLFIDSFDTQKLGGYDPYMNEFVLSSNQTKVPLVSQPIACGVTKTFLVKAGTTTEFNVDVGPFVGTVTVSYNIVSADGTINISNLYNSTTTSSGNVNTSGSYTFTKDSVSKEICEMDVTTSTGTATVEITVSCPDPDIIRIFQICISNNSEAGELIHNQYRWVDGTFVSPLHSTQVELATGTESPLVSQYESIQGQQGGGVIPADGATVSIISNKIPPTDNFVFDNTVDEFRFLRTNTLYTNTTSDITSLLSASTLATPISGTLNTFQASFTMPASGQYLYLIYDYRNGLAITLCYDSSTALASCCTCGTQATYFIDGNSLANATAVYTDANLTTKAADGFYSSGGNVRQQSSGLLLPQQSCPSCGGGGSLRMFNSSTGTVFNGTCNINGNINPINQIYYHDGANALPVSGDTCYEDAAGTTPLSAFYYTIGGTSGMGNRQYIRIMGNAGVVSSGYPANC